MGFLTPTDYDFQIREFIKQTISPADDSLELAEMAAQTQMETKLRSRYDVAANFSKTGNQRHKELVMYMIDITLYHLHTSITPRNIPELREKRYKAAMEWLKMVAAGELNPDLVLLPDQDSYNLRVGSNQKYSRQW